MAEVTYRKTGLYWDVFSFQGKVLLVNYNEYWWILLFSMVVATHPTCLSPLSGRCGKVNLLLEGLVGVRVDNKSCVLQTLGYEFWLLIAASACQDAGTELTIMVSPNQLKRLPGDLKETVISYLFKKQAGIQGNLESHCTCPRREAGLIWISESHIIRKVKM